MQIFFLIFFIHQKNLVFLEDFETLFYSDLKKLTISSMRVDSAISGRKIEDSSIHRFDF